MEFKNRVIKTSEIDWKNIKLFQPKKFKIMTNIHKKRLKASLIENGLTAPFYVWENKGEIYCLDGHMRIPIMKELEKEGYKIPKKLPANFIDCKNEKEAQLAVLIYNSRYSEINKKEFDKIIIDLDISKIYTINVENFAKEIIKKEKDDIIEQMELKPFEHHDYLIFYFNNVNDFLAACNKFGVKKVKYSFDMKNKKIGLGRVIDGKKLL